MPLINSLAEHLDDIRAWRHDIHAHPELQYDVHRTAALVAEKLQEFGLDEVVTGIGRTGVVGVIRGKGQSSGKTVGLRADMDALPIQEVRDLPHKSQIDGAMHACGHDGHTAMLLGAARHLAENRDFDGTVVVIFQPAEEGGAGGKAMVDDGMMERFGIQEVYGMHNVPGLPVGSFASNVGPLMAAAAHIEIRVEGKGAHAALPHDGVDTIVVATALVQALQSIVSRNLDPIDQAVVSITQIHAGDAFNVIPPVAELAGTVRTFLPETRDMVERRIEEICAGVAAEGVCACQAFFPASSAAASLRANPGPPPIGWGRSTARSSRRARRSRAAPDQIAPARYSQAWRGCHCRGRVDPESRPLRLSRSVACHRPLIGRSWAGSGEVRRRL